MPQYNNFISIYTSAEKAKQRKIQNELHKSGSAPTYTNNAVE